MRRRHQQAGAYGRLGIGWLCVAGLLLGGCVSQSRYDAAAADTKAAEAEVEKIRTMREALVLDTTTLRTNNERAARDLEVIKAEVQRLEERRKRERVLFVARQKKLVQVVRTLEKKLRAALRANQGLRQHNRALQTTVHNYEHELKNARAPVELPRAHDAPAPPAAGQPGPPETRPAEAPLDDAHALVNINSASLNELVTVLGLTEDMAAMVIANRPYRLRGQLRAKDVLPDAVFADIRDRVTVRAR